MAKPRTLEELLEEAKRFDLKDFELPPTGEYAPDPNPEEW